MENDKTCNRLNENENKKKQDEKIIINTQDENMIVPTE
jgi:hypothetical protein